jgi:hypothetical protein
MEELCRACRMGRARAGCWAGIDIGAREDWRACRCLGSGAAIAGADLLFLTAS